jgi:Tol biopolymer transport system component
MDADGANRRQLTTDAQVDERGMCLTPDGKFLVFTSWRSGKSNLWRVEADGKNLTQLTFGEADAHPECTPDGESVIYQRGILSQPSLWKISVSGGEPVKLTDFRAKWGAISTDGKQISFFQMKDDKWQICLIGADGGAISNRIDVPPIQRENTIRWSPDNRNLQFIGVNGNVGNIWSLPLDGSPPKQETNFDSHWLDDFLPSPDKKKFALARRLSVSDMILIKSEK